MIKNHQYVQKCNQVVDESSNRKWNCCMWVAPSLMRPNIMKHPSWADLLVKYPIVLSHSYSILIYPLKHCTSILFYDYVFEQLSSLPTMKGHLFLFLVLTYVFMSVEHLFNELIRFVSNGSAEEHDVC